MHNTSLLHGAPLQHCFPCTPPPPGLWLFLYYSTLAAARLSSREVSSLHNKSEGDLRTAWARQASTQIINNLFNATINFSASQKGVSQLKTFSFFSHRRTTTPSRPRRHKTKGFFILLFDMSRRCGHSPSTHSRSMSVSMDATRRPTARAPKTKSPTNSTFPQCLWMEHPKEKSSAWN